MPIVKAPNKYNKQNNISIFLAGSIEMGSATDWQTKLGNLLIKKYPKLLVLNPRRNDWDDSWEQSKDDKQFRGQVEWELSSQEVSEVVALYFDPETKSPISLLELGLFGEKMVVYCPEGFWRKGNVDIVCERYNIPVFDNKKEWLQALIVELDELY